MRKTNDPNTGTGTFVGAVGNAVTILRHLAHAGRPEGVAQIARATETNTSTCFNILRTLHSEGLVDFSEQEKLYSLSIGMLELALPVMASNAPDLIRPVLARVSREEDTLIALWQITALERLVLIDRIVENQILRIDMRPGTRLPSFVGALGRCVAAERNLVDSELERRFLELRWANAPQFEDYLADVAQARIDGYAIDHGQLYNLIDIVAASVRDAQGIPRLGISAIGIRGQKTPEQLHQIGRSLKTAADRISLTLFGRRADKA